MDLSPYDFEGLWSTRKTSNYYSYRMAPKRHMSIIQGHTSNAKGWFERFFYVRINGASILGDMIWNAVALYRSRGISRPLRASDMDEPHPDAVLDKRERVRPRKDKVIALEDRNFFSEDLPLPRWNPGFTPGDRSGTSEAPLPNDFFANLPPGFITPASLDEASRREVVAEGSRLINEVYLRLSLPCLTLDGNFREARLSHFKAEETERKFIHFQNEVAERERRQAESHSRALIRAERKGRRAIAAELARRATLFDVEFRSFKDAQDYVGDFRECRALVGTLWKSQNADFSFLSEVSEMSGLMDGCTQAESMVPPIDRRILELWEPIEVSEDTTEAGADAADEGGEVDQPADSEGCRDWYSKTFRSFTKFRERFRCGR
ncbi:BnaC05g11120D [Brassica napus]|uniref:BnaC05g11120D protein n=1 Tax=Brassica napus TaxID=3708 RepID=A0A078HTV8_BRANA|nr:BnaC05g11120D [Brassica napus]